MSDMTEQQNDEQEPLPQVDSYGLRYGTTVLPESSLIFVCQALVDALDDDGLKKMYDDINNADDFLSCLRHAIAFHTNMIVEGMRVRAATMERTGATIQ